MYLKYFDFFKVEGAPYIWMRLHSFFVIDVELFKSSVRIA